MKVCKAKCEKYHGLPFAFSTFDEISKELVKISFSFSSKKNQNLDFNITSYYIDAEYNFKDFTWYSRLATNLISYEILYSILAYYTYDNA